MNIYHYSSEALYQHPSYQQCSLIVDHTKDISVPCSDQFEPLIPHNVVNVPQDHSCGKIEVLVQKTKSGKSVKNLKTNVDTSNFSIEERLVAAVWIHERKRLKNSISQIRQDFRIRFGREPPAKNTLLVWERKLFSTGSVCDAPRPGRPINRRSRVDEVASSMRTSPALSLRARAVSLRMSRTTLRSILQKDLPHTLSLNNDVGPTKNLGRQVKRSKKRASGSTRSHTTLEPQI